MGGRSGRPGGKDRSSRPGKSKRHRTGDSSSPTESSESDEANFEMRKSKRMNIEREKMRPLNMDKRDLNKAIFKDRSKAGSSLADVQPMEMDMGVTFDSVGGLKEHVNSLKEMVMFPLLYPELFQKFQIQPPRGVLFYGPPGTGKTLLARALACECSTENRKVAFFMRKGADCLSKWIGESERQLRLLFDQAYQMRPSIIFFDEIDGLAPVRSSRQDQIHSSIVSTLLALMDGLDSRGEVVLIGATNRLENIDPALRRPGRFDRELRFALPDRRTRKEILQLHTKAWEPPIAPPLLNTLATRTIGYCGADLKGLAAEAALNALRRRYPQVYESNKKLAIEVGEVEVLRPDFDKALRKIVCSTHRVEDKLLGPLPRRIRPLLQETLAALTKSVKRIFPHSGAGKGAVLPSVLTHRPRLLVLASEGQGQRTYLAPALLHMMEAMPCQKLDIPALFSNSARSPEEAITQIIHTARRTQPGVLYIPHLLALWDTVGETVKATLLTLLADLPPVAPLLILAVADCAYSHLPPELRALFVAYYRETHRIENPGENERREYFRPLVASCSAPPPKAPSPGQARQVEALAVLPAPESRKLTAREEKRLRRKEETLLRELRIFLRDIWAKINRENKFFMFRYCCHVILAVVTLYFRSPVNVDDVDDYLQFVKDPMDLEKMHMKLDDGEYPCAQVDGFVHSTFLTAIPLRLSSTISTWSRRTRSRTTATWPTRPTGSSCTVPAPSRTSPTRSSRPRWTRTSRTSARQSWRDARTRPPGCRR
jgi:SpoVK/Ycf46/Vps4 family AAA+-type ATPase